MATGVTEILVGGHRLHSKEMRELVLTGGIHRASSQRARSHMDRQARVVRRLEALLLFALCSFCFGFTGFANSYANSLSSSNPVAGSVLTTSPNSISLTTANPLADQGNQIMVTDPNGTEVDDGSLAVNGNTAVIGMKPLTATGIYTVTYTLISPTDPAVTGSYTFLFNAPSVISSSTPTPTPTSSTNSTPAASSTGINTLVIVLLILAGIVFILLIWYARKTFGSGGNPRGNKSKR